MFSEQEKKSLGARWQELYNKFSLYHTTLLKISDTCKDDKTDKSEKAERIGANLSIIENGEKEYTAYKKECLQDPTFEEIFSPLVKTMDEVLKNDIKTARASISQVAEQENKGSLAEGGKRNEQR